MPESMNCLQDEFARHGPWVTAFHIDGHTYGGTFDAARDPRLDQFFERFPKARTILELGSLEGGHTFCLGAHPGVRRVLGIEGRASNIERARVVQRLVASDTVEFAQANLESVDLAPFGEFDAVFCVGLLYHLPEPWKLLDQIARVTNQLFVWTHYASKPTTRRRAFRYSGILYQEHGLYDALSGMSARSFWPTFDSLTKMLMDSGFADVAIIEKDTGHPHGPCVTLAAVRR